jgi:putative nucleotidyltransferase with HDIG domain
MYIHDLNCGWMEHPFPLNTLKVDDQKTIQKIIASGIREVYIDTEKGLDVVHARTQEDIDSELNDRITAVAGAFTRKPVNAIPLDEEIANTRELRVEAHQVVHNFMSDAKLGKQIRLEETTPVVERVFDSIMRNQDAFIALSRIKHKDEYTYQHSLSVCALLTSFCRTLDYEKGAIIAAGLGGLLHDVGKMRTPDAVLNKSGPLTEEEMEVMHSHASLGREILRRSPGIPEAAVVIAGQHHERFDGLGYPDRLKGEQISVLGQMASIADVYDALTSNRVYHKGVEPTAALKKLYEWSRFHFNARLVERFICMIGIYPVGSLVRLESGLLAVVVNPGEQNLLRPQVRIVYDTKRDFAVSPHDIDLARQTADSIVGHESPQKWNISPVSYLEQQ